jgi:hypothetical protein
MTRESNLKSGSVGSVGSAELLAIRNLYSRHPEYFHHESWELVHVLYSLNYTDDLADEREIAVAVRGERLGRARQPGPGTPRRRG